MTATFERCERVGCSQTYFEDGARLLVHPDTGINSICDLEGEHVAVNWVAKKQRVILTRHASLVTHYSSPIMNQKGGNLDEILFKTQPVYNGKLTISALRRANAYLASTARSDEQRSAA